MQELDSTAEFDASRDAEFFAAVPARPSVFAIGTWRGINWREAVPLAYRKSAAAPCAFAGPPDPASKRLNLREFAARVRYHVVGRHLN